MIKSARRLRAVFVAAAVACAMLAVASSAAAVPASWSTQGNVTLQGPMTLHLDGGSPVSCNISLSGQANNSPSGFFMLGGGITNFCGAQVYAAGQGVNESGYKLSFASLNRWWGSPYGSYYQQPFKVPFVNGSGGTSSQVTFNATQIGTNYQNKSVTATGTLTLTTSGGGLITLN